MLRVCVYHGPGRLAVEERPEPAPRPGEVLVRTQAASLCFSDIRVYKGEKRALPGVVLGHEIAGTVVEVGPGVEGVASGQAVAVCPIVSCGQCHFCRLGKQNRCERRTTLGYDHDGGLAEYVVAPAALVDAGHLLTLPPDLPWDIACQVEPFACALNSLETCRVGAGATLAILGAGPMGLTHLILARGLGAGRILVIEPIAERRAAAVRLGATVCVDPTRDDPTQAALQMTGGLGVDAAVVTVGSVPAMEAALPLVRKQGWINLFGGAPPESVLRLDPNLIHYNELVLTGTQNAALDHYRRALELLGHLPQANALITHRFPIERTPEAFQARLELEGLKAVIDFP